MNVSSNAHSFVNNYMLWLKNNIIENKITNDTYRVTTPFLDRNNDHIEVYVIMQDKNNFKITDDGATVGELLFSGFSIKGSNKRQDIFNTIIASHGVSSGDNNELYVDANMSNFAMKKHMLTQCMIKVSDLFSLSQPNIKSIFLEDIKYFLESNDIRFTERTSFLGKSRLVNNFDFVIAGHKEVPERIIRGINTIRADYAKSIIFSWEDIKETRPKNATLYTFINDDGKKASKEALQALHEYDIKPVLWSERQNYIEELVA